MAANVFIDTNSFKNGPLVEYFTPFNDAPVDDPAFAGMDFGLGCWVASYCGMALNRHGYYAYSVAGGIDRVMGFGLACGSLGDGAISFTI